MDKKKFLNNLKNVGKVLLFLVGGIVGGYLLLVAVFTLPKGRIYNNVAQSGRYFEGGHPPLINDYLTTKKDTWTDALMLLTAKDNTDNNPFTSSIYAYHPEREDEAPPHVIITDIENPTNYPLQYSRYWHGYLLLLKPMLMIFNYDEILVIDTFVVLVLIAGVIYALQKKKMIKYIIPYMITVALMYPIAISLSMQYVALFVIFNVATILITLCYEKLAKINAFPFVFLIIGMLTCYFDFLTYPVITLGIPLLIWILMENRSKEKTIGQNVKSVFKGSLLWALGYFGIWVGKWIIGSIITGDNLFNSAMDAASTRASSMAGMQDLPRYYPITQAFEQIFIQPVWLVLVIIVIVIIVMLARKKLVIEKERLLKNLWMLIIAVIPMVWYLVLTNHSAWHMFFTYRAMGVFIFAIGCYVTSLLDVRDEKLSKRRLGKKLAK